jgi:16S rRNA (guanine1207-N2)-methyltransferase
MSEEDYVARERTWELERYPKFGDSNLRAWSAADEYLVENVQLGSRGKQPRILVLNDAFGALSIPFSDCKTTVMLDSWLSEVSIRRNLERNGLSRDAIEFLGPTDEIKGKFDILIIGIPKSLTLLEYMLRRARLCLQPKCQVLAAAMVKYAHPSLYTLFQQTLGPTLAMPARKKARLFEIELDTETKRPLKDIPFRTYRLSDPDAEICSGPGVFSADRLDNGTRMFLNHLPVTASPLAIGDLGCGAGILGMAVALQCPNATLVMADESRMALLSAKETLSRAGVEPTRTKFRLAHGWDGTPADSLDFVVSNPPIHQGNSLNPWMAFQMFRQSHKVLKKGGSFRFVTMRRLECQEMLKDLYSEVAVLQEEGDYRIFNCIK